MPPKRLTRRVWSNPSIEWYGFEPVGYILDAKRVSVFPVSIESPGGDSREATVIDVIRLFNDQEILDLEPSLNVTVTVAEGKYILRAGSQFVERLLSALLAITRAKENPFYVTWCYWGHDHVTDDVHEAYEFFVAAGDRIVLERVAFGDHTDSGFDPTVFVGPDAERPIWRNEPYWKEATVRRAYRRFYTETATGQLLVLRPDQPPIYHCHDQQASSLALLTPIAADLARIRFRIGVVLLMALALLVLYLIRP